MTKSQLWQVGKTQSTTGIGGRQGFGFNIQDGRGAPLLNISYATEEEAKKAEEVIRQTIENAINIVPHSHV